MKTIYQYNAKKEYVSTITIDKNSVLPNNSTMEPIPSYPWNNVWPVFNTDINKWVFEEDYRNRPSYLFESEQVQEGTKYWLPEDTYEELGREMKDVGPLPEGATTIQPVKSDKQLLEEAKTNKLNEFSSVMDANDIKMLRPLSNDETDKIDIIKSIQNTNRELRQQVLLATTVEAVEAINPIEVNFTKE